jgi:hypothetical protein
MYAMTYMHHLALLKLGLLWWCQSEFEALLRSQYPWAFDHTEGWVVAIRYEDESGDLCILSSQPEWDALCHNPLLGRIVRVFINHGTVACSSALLLRVVCSLAVVSLVVSCLSCRVARI